jgi:hypothetical protein
MQQIAAVQNSQQQRDQTSQQCVYKQPPASASPSLCAYSNSTKSGFFDIAAAQSLINKTDQLTPITTPVQQSLQFLHHPHHQGVSGTAQSIHSRQSMMSGGTTTSIASQPPRLVVYKISKYAIF